MTIATSAVDLVQARWWQLLLLLVVARLVRNHFRSGIHGIPGPFLASLSDVWLFFHCWLGQPAYDFKLHRKYNSPLLRLGPKTIAVSDAEAVRIIYGYKPVFNKVGNSTSLTGHWNLNEDPIEPVLHHSGIYEQ